MMKISNQTLLDRGVAEVIKRKSLEKRLNSGQKLRIKYGIDPTGTEIHLGHLVPLLKLKQFQKAGHQIIFLIGDFTAKIGDPSGRSKTRPQLTDEEIEKNESGYRKQIKEIVDLEKTEVRHNSEWFGKLNFSEVLKLASSFSLSRIVERDDFEKRIKKGEDVRYHEGLYPIMQAYDSVMLKADVEIGGTDQKFNLLAGRTLQKYQGQEPQDILMMPILTGTDGKKKMSKSYDNQIGVREPAKEQYGKIMSIPDVLIVEYFHLVTELTDFEVKEIEAELELGKNPKEVKKRLARTIVTKLYSGAEAEKAESSFEQVFERGESPTEMEEVALKVGSKKKIIDLLMELKLATSRTDGYRLIKQGGVRIDQAVISNPQAKIAIHDGMVVNVGKLKFKRIVKK
jgi:tyrosyl-tRNA synthetase